MRFYFYIYFFYWKRSLTLLLTKSCFDQNAYVPPTPHFTDVLCMCVCAHMCTHSYVHAHVCLHIYLCAFKVGLALLASFIGIAHSHCYATSCGFPLEGSQGVCILYSSFVQCPQLCASLRGSTLEIIVSLLLFLAWVSQRKWTSQTSRW